MYRRQDFAQLGVLCTEDRKFTKGKKIRIIQIRAELACFLSFVHKIQIRADARALELCAQKHCKQLSNNKNCKQVRRANS
jgi:hypothetical protein